MVASVRRTIRSSVPCGTCERARSSLDIQVDVQRLSYATCLECQVQCWMPLYVAKLTIFAGGSDPFPSVWALGREFKINGMLEAACGRPEPESYQARNRNIESPNAVCTNEKVFATTPMKSKWLLFVSQRFHWIGLCRAVCGDEAGPESHYRQHDGDTGKGSYIERRHTVKQASEPTCQ